MMMMIIIMTKANTRFHKQPTEEAKQAVQAQAGLVLLLAPSFQPYINVATKGGQGVDPIAAQGMSGSRTGCARALGEGLAFYLEEEPAAQILGCFGRCCLGSFGRGG